MHNTGYFIHDQKKKVKENLQSIWRFISMETSKVITAYTWIFSFICWNVNGTFGKVKSLPTSISFSLGVSKRIYNVYIFDFMILQWPCKPAGEYIIFRGEIPWWSFSNGQKILAWESLLSSASGIAVLFRSSEWLSCLILTFTWSQFPGFAKLFSFHSSSVLLLFVFLNIINVIPISNYIPFLNQKWLY